MKEDGEDKSIANKPQEKPHQVRGQPPFKEFQQTLAFLASIGLAASVASAFSLVGVTSSLGDTSPAALQAVKNSAEMLAWAASCFIVSIAVIITTQIVYTEEVIVTILILTKAELRQWQEKLVRFGFASFAWTALAFQTAGMLLFAQALGLFSSQCMEMARYGVVGGMGLVAGVTVLGLLSQKEGRQKMFGIFLSGNGSP